MAESTSASSLNIRGLILVPSLLTLGITFLRLGAELAHWSPRFFSTAAGGGAAIVGISWLPIIFGPYFAVKLTKSGRGAPSPGKAIGWSVLGIIVFVAAMFVGFGPKLNFPGRELVGYLLLALAASVVTLGWHALFRVLLAYAYAARIPVAIVMFFAIRGHWGTHYDVISPVYAGSHTFFDIYMKIAFLPQMVMWIAYTVLVGALFGSIVASLVCRGKGAPAEN
jgi:hypothetical protein